MIKGITFDLWNTLLCNRDYGNYRIDLLTQTLREEGFPRDRRIVEMEYLATADFFYEVWMKERRHMPASRLMKFILKRLNIHLPANIRRRLVEEFEEAIFIDPPPLMEEADEVLKSLHSQYRTGLISNSGVTPGRNLRRVLRDHKVLQYFTCTVFSDEVGYHKPHPMIFRRAIEKLQVEAKAVVHVGDLLEADVEGAKAIGMKAIWFNMGERRYPPNKKETAPDYEIRTLSQLMDILGNISE